MLYNIDGKHSVRTLHERQGKDYAGTPSAAELELESKHNNAPGKQRKET